jgi:hypothetical protein
LAGSARLTVWGFDVYDARLWISDDFRRDDFARHRFALELSYLRSFASADIAKHSLAEMQRMSVIAPAQAAAWLQALRRALPDVRKGDRITGVHRPGAGVVFLINGRLGCEIRDADFSSHFFAIWLSAQTSEPALRQALLAQAP